MSQLFIQQYLNQLSTLKKVLGSQRESVLREAFKDLLQGWARSRGLHFIPEYEIESKTKEESKPKDPTIREKFDNYRFADHKEKVVELLARVTTVSVETQRIVEAMKKAQRWSLTLWASPRRPALAAVTSRLSSASST